MDLRFRRFVKRYWILLILIVIKLILQYLVVNPVYELHRDEFLYLNQANHLAFGYISVPPFTACISKIIYLLGGGMFFIRFFPALFGALTIVFTWLIVESLGGSLFSRILASCALIFSLLARINILYQPNSFDFLTWTILFYLLTKFIQSEKTKWLWFLSIVVAIGFYNKYNLIFLIIGLIIGFLLMYQRKIFANPSFWNAVIICLILLSPNIIWQGVNHFPVFHHMKVLRSKQLYYNTSAGFLKSQVLYFLGSLPLTVGAIIAFVFFKPFRPFRFIGISFVAVIALFAFLKAKDYYAAGIYPVMIAFGSVYLDNILSKRWRSIVLPLLICMNLGIFLITLKVVYPILTPAEIRQNAKTFEKIGVLRWEDGKNHTLPQDFADMIGWREMADKSLGAFKMIPPNELGNTLVVCNNYGQAGALNYYNRGKMPEAYSLNTDYIYWLPHLKKIKNILLIGQKPGQEVIDMFKDFKLVGVIENEYAREKNTGIY
ncbi:MAG: glycosyltransferase family 39 protein, partial [Bacteroidales bacterium]